MGETCKMGSMRGMEICWSMLVCSAYYFFPNKMLFSFGVDELTPY